MTRQWALGKKVRFEDGRQGCVVDAPDPDGPETCLCMRWEDDDGTERELVAGTSRFEVIG